MKRHLLIFALPFALLASEMPPMPPGFFDSKPKEVKEKKEEKREVKKEVRQRPFPKECDVLPPMLFVFPPPMQKDWDNCQVARFKPSEEALMQNISKLENGAGIEVVSVKEADNFKLLYEVKYKITSAKKDSKFKVLNKKEVDEKVVYSNPQATKFFINKPIEVK